MNPIDEIIKRAQERGDFDNLPGAGKPQDLSENPWVPPDWRMGYRMLAGSGFAPGVVEDDKALRARIAELQDRLERFGKRWDLLTPEQRRDRQQQRDTCLHEYEDEIRAINGRIHSFNALAPRAMNRGTLPVSKMVDAAKQRLPLD
jgi:DnaJ family protein C protein 28